MTDPSLLKRYRTVVGLLMTQTANLSSLIESSEKLLAISLLGPRRRGRVRKALKTAKEQNEAVAEALLELGPLVMAEE